MLGTVGKVFVLLAQSVHTHTHTHTGKETDYKEAMKKNKKK